MGRDRGLAKTVDWWLVICWLLLVFIGWGNIYASIHASEPSSIFDFDFRSGKQFIWMITAFIIAGLVLFVIPPRLYEGLSLPIYLFMIGLLVAVIFLGIEVKGSRSWFAFGPVRFQPAEFSKISTSLLLATVMSQLGYRIGRFKDFIITALIILIPMMIIVLQSETGSAFLKDANGKALKNKKVTIRLNGKKYVKTTNSNGRVSLKVSLKAGSYKVKLYYSGSKYYKAKSKSLTMKVVKSTSVYKSANGCIWLWNSLKNEVNFKTLKNNGIKNIFISYVAVESSDFDAWLNEANSYGMKVHIWMQAFYDKKWINPILSDGSINNTLLNKIARNAESYAKIKGVSGVHLDYIRFPGTAYKYKNGEKAVSELARKVSESVKQVNSSIVVSCSVMGESLYSNSYYYGQNLTKLSQYVDVIVPMLYKGNYGQSSSWIKTQTASYVKAVGSNAKIWVGLQSYKSDDDLTKLSISALSQDAANAIKGGANGIALFRYGLTNFINMTRIIA